MKNPMKKKAQHPAIKAVVFTPAKGKAKPAPIVVKPAKSTPAAKPAKATRRVAPAKPVKAPTLKPPTPPTAATMAAAATERTAMTAAFVLALEAMTRLFNAQPDKAIRGRLAAIHNVMLKGSRLPRERLDETGEK